MPIGTKQWQKGIFYMSETEYRWPLFWPHIPDKKKLFAELEDTLDTRWIGQGPKVDLFEKEFKKKFDATYAVAVSSGTAALHLAYTLAGFQGEVISPVLTCTATNHALLYRRVKIHFCDIDPSSLNPDPAHARQLCEANKINAIVAVHLGGDPCDIDGFLELGEEYGIPVIFDAAQALGAKYNGVSICAPSNCGFATCYSFQAIKHITTGDGGMLALPAAGRDEGLEWASDVTHEIHIFERAKRLRWFGIDREAKAREYDWQPMVGRKSTSNQRENGYKYQMTDLDACWGLAGLKEFNEILTHRKQLAYLYTEKLQDVDGIELLRADTDRWKSSHWIFGFLVENREDFFKFMKSRGVETSVVQVRNDVNDIFGGKKQELPGMNKVEDKYMYLPLHTKMDKEDIEQICEIIQKGW